MVQGAGAGALCRDDGCHPRAANWFEAGLLAALLWPVSTVLVDFLYARVTFDEEPAVFLDRFAFWWGAPYLLLVLLLFAAPLIAGKLFARQR